MAYDSVYDSVYGGETYGQRAARQRAENDKELASASIFGTLPKAEPRQFPIAQEFIDSLGINSSTILTDTIDINGCLLIFVGPDGRYLVTEDRAGEKCIVSRHYAWPTMAVGLHILDLLFHEGWRGGK